MNTFFEYSPIKYNKRKFELEELNFLFLQQEYYGNLYKDKFSPPLTDGFSSSDTETSSTINNNITEQTKDTEINIKLKKPNPSVLSLIKAHSEKGCLCNYILFKNSIDIKICSKQDKKVTLKDYLNIFNELGFMCLSVPYIDKNGKLEYNIFNPTLSSMNLILNMKKNNIKYNSENNFSVHKLSNGLIQIIYDENIPPYNRDIIDSKVKILHKIVGKKSISLDKIEKEESYFSILWTPADTYKINSSFLAFYNFNYELIGVFINKRNDYKWFTCFSYGVDNFRDFKNDYLTKVIEVEEFLKKCHTKKGEDNVDIKYFSCDFKKYKNNL
jgi:hypothetical protein